MNTWTAEPFFEVWQRIMADAPVPASAEQLVNLVSAVAAEREASRQLEKRARRRQRWIDRHSGRGHLWA
jgi:hypothetical protein